MVPKIVSRGKSFKGCVKYCMHDPNADTSERVSFVETRNLQTSNPDIAWRIMAATAMDQQRLKEQAGIKSTGRKSSLTVQHLMISWHPEEAEGLTIDEMHAAAESAIAAIGASDHQAVMFGHDDTEKPHVHIVINRVSPIDGRMLSSSKEKLKLSAWAQNYEEQRGKIYCEERVINNAARRRGEYTRGVKSKARHLHELEQKTPANDHSFKAMRADQRTKDAELASRGRDLEAQHRKQWSKLEREHNQRAAKIRGDTAKAIGRAKTKVRQAFRDRWTEHYHEQQASMTAFEKREKTFLGRITNRFKSVDLPKIISGDEQGHAIGEVFSVFTSKAGRKDAEIRRIKAKETALMREQHQAEQAAAVELRSQEQEHMANNRKRYLAERSDLVLHQNMAKAKLRSQWKQRNHERKAAHARFDKPAPTKAVRPGTSKAPPTFKAAAEQDNKAPKLTSSSDLLPKTGAEERAGQVDQFKDLSEQRAARKRRQRKDRGDKDRGR